jgi:hypothetical protein
MPRKRTRVAFVCSLRSRVRVPGIMPVPGVTHPGAQRQGFRGRFRLRGNLAGPKGARAEWTGQNGLNGAEKPGRKSRMAWAKWPRAEKTGPMNWKVLGTTPLTPL